jgi:hypothetical protein
MTLDELMHVLDAELQYKERLRAYMAGPRGFVPGMTDPLSAVLAPRAKPHAVVDVERRSLGAVRLRRRA